MAGQNLRGYSEAICGDAPETPEVNVILPAEPSTGDPGWRLHLFRGTGEQNIFLADERVFPEKVHDPDANRVLESSGRIMLTDREARWLRDQLIKMTMGTP